MSDDEKIVERVYFINEFLDEYYGIPTALSGAAKFLATGTGTLEDHEYVEWKGAPPYALPNDIVKMSVYEFYANRKIIGGNMVPHPPEDADMFVVRYGKMNNWDTDTLIIGTADEFIQTHLDDQYDDGECVIGVARRREEVNFKISYDLDDSSKVPTLTEIMTEKVKPCQ